MVLGWCFSPAGPALFAPAPGGGLAWSFQWEYDRSYSVWRGLSSCGYLAF